jgi:uncharacterized protein (TIGR03435 family)
VMLVFGLPRLHGQAAPTSEAAPAFEAASVKPNLSRDGERGASFTGGRFAMTDATLRDLVTFAYQRQDGRLRSESEVTGGPVWLNSDRFDVVAKAEGMGVGIDGGNTAAGAATAAELSGIIRVRMMLRGLLADRFKLTVHNELRELAAYALLRSRNDGTPGPQLKAVDIDCAALRTSALPLPARGRGNTFCGGFKQIGPGHISGHVVTMAMLGVFLEGSVSRNVFDRTGLRGTFDVDLQWTPDQLRDFKASAGLPPGTLPRVNGVQFDPDGPSIFTAIQEQLGLKLESTKAPVDVLMIDHAEKPAPD